MRLVVPRLDEAGELSLGPLKVHAGGLARTGRWLHVAATAKGFWTAHLDDIVSVDGEMVLPVRHAHRATAPEGVERLRYSFFSAGASGIVVGEYGRGKKTRRLACIPVDPATDLPCGAPVVAGDGVAGMQGVVERDGRWLGLHLARPVDARLDLVRHPGRLHPPPLGDPDGTRGPVRRPRRRPVDRHGAPAAALDRAPQPFPQVNSATMSALPPSVGLPTASTVAEVPSSLASTPAGSSGSVV